MLKKFFILIAFTYSSLGFSQFGVELGAGMNASYDPSYTGFSHFQGGVTYDFDESYGAKFDFGYDKFSIDNELRGKKTGVTNTRATLQGTVNLSSAFGSNSFYNKFNLLAHGGAGLSIIKSDIPEFTKTDHLLNVMVGLTPRVEVSERFYIFGDASLLLNVSQHYLFNGEIAYVGAANSFTGVMFNASIGIAYKFDRY